MSLRDDLLPVLDQVARSIPDQLGFRQDVVTIRTRVWPGTRGDLSQPPVDTDLVLAPRPKNRRVTAREVAASGGLYRQTDMLVGPITPAYTDGVTSGGYTDAQLRPTAPNDQTEIVYLVNADEYDLLEFRAEQATKRWFLLRRKETTP